MGYELASSSVEEGEIPDTTFPYYKSYNQYYYYPYTTKFIGKNTVPHSMNYKGDMYSTRLKKEIKQDYSYIPFNLLENSKTFFNNKFVFVKELEKAVYDMPALRIPHLFTSENGEEILSGDFVLREIKADYKEIYSFDRRSVCESRYDKFYQQLFFTQDNKPGLKKSFQNYTFKKIILIEDRALEALDMDNAYLFCRVMEERPCSTDSEPIKKIIFEDIFYSKASFYEYLGLYAEYVVKSYNSEEIRIYENRNALLVVYSSTVFKKGPFLKRIYGGIDVKKDTMLICNNNGPTLIDVSGSQTDNAAYFDGLDMPEGDYVINNKKLYKIDNNGKQVEFGDIDFTDFVKAKCE
ncbi:hypothetical protein PAEPH01_0385 [Pancytospora epiphaga]|nr:hypothetical protein PAEPH01_0385 [Pancytospora epiphaga]